MASIEERLGRREWDPSPEDTLIGEIVKVTERETQFGWYPILAVADGDGAEWVVHCIRAGLANPVMERQPKPGERIGIRYLGTVQSASGQDAHRYNVEFEDDGAPEPDWDRMRESRKKDKGGKPTAGMVDDSWAGTPAEPPF